jgi:hypothetical protein
VIEQQRADHEHGKADTPIYVEWNNIGIKKIDNNQTQKKELLKNSLLWRI